MDKITIIVPCYNEEEALPIYYKEMKNVMQEMRGVQFELIFVDDGSSDSTLKIMKALNRKDPRCQYLSFSRNFGKEAAIYAGLKNASGEFAAIMDVDLQAPPRMLHKMDQILKEGDYDSVATKRSTRTGEPRIRSFLSERFYRLISGAFGGRNEVVCQEAVYLFTGGNYSFFVRELWDNICRKLIWRRSTGRSLF